MPDTQEHSKLLAIQWNDLESAAQGGSIAPCIVTVQPRRIHLPSLGLWWNKRRAWVADLMSDIQGQAEVSG